MLFSLLLVNHPLIVLDEGCMSLQRIIELARRQGMPIIMTDVGGREPMVLLSLDTYEEMLDVKPTEPLSDVAKAPPQGRPAVAEKDQKSAHSSEGSRNSKQVAPTSSAPDGLRVRQRDEDRTQALHRSLDSVSHEVLASAPSQMGGGEGMVMEERFSFQS